MDIFIGLSKSSTSSNSLRVSFQGLFSPQVNLVVAPLHEGHSFSLQPCLTIPFPLHSGQFSKLP